MSVTANADVVMFVVVRCVCAKATSVNVPVGTRIQFFCQDRRCGRWNDTIAR